ncbi:MAG: endolytic transglycosylase MltG [Bdellovibrionales bacterium]|nr:endolytic transglycosylase MltG [Bdellovibrionales bacterium]
MRILFIIFLFFLSFGCKNLLPVFLTEKNKQVIVDIKPGQSFSKLNDNLEKKSLVRYPLIFKIFAKITKYDKSIRPGEYLVSNTMSYLQILSIFKNGPRQKKDITIPEGFNIFQIAKLLEQKKFGSAKIFLNLCKNINFINYLFKKYSKKNKIPNNIINLEGYLFPDTYYFYKYDSEKSIIESLVKNFFENYQDIKLNKNNKLSMHQIVILASIVEKETGSAKERPLIAGVFFNRLKIGMRLQTDPTILYGMWVNGSTSNNIRRKDILAYTKYNTYRVKALPAGPISNPGLDAIRAVLLPKKSKFLYFVSKNNGKHIFTTNYKDHLKYVRKHQLRRKSKKSNPAK